MLARTARPSGCPARLAPHSSVNRPLLRQPALPRSGFLLQLQRWSNSKPLVVLLTQDVERLGQKGELVGVKKGYARNFLLPNQKAVLPSDFNLKAFAEYTALIDPKRKEAIKQAKKTQERLGKIQIRMRRGVGADGALVYPVDAQKICDLLLKRYNERIPVKEIEFATTRETGSTYANIHLVEDIYARISVTIDPR